MKSPSDSSRSVSIAVDSDSSVTSTDTDSIGEPSLRRDVSRSGLRGDRRSIVGHTISDRYRIDELIAEGGMGAVYRGEHVHMRKRIAVKVLRPETEGFPELVTRFEREAVAGAHIDHPNVASATDFGRLSDGSYFLILEYVDGVTLRDRMKAGPVGPIDAARIARQLAEALGACHQMQVVHRDVKPRNVMLEAGTGRVKLIDFGLAKVPSRPSRVDPPEDEEETRRNITLKGIVFGTVAYLAPEAQFGMDAVDHRADLYALGVVLYELCTGRHPFDATDPSALFLCHKAVPPPTFRERAPDRTIPSALEALTMRLLAKNPDERHPNADAVVAAIDAALGSGIQSESTFDRASVTVNVPAPAAPGPEAALVVPEFRPRRRLVGWAAAAVLVAGVAAAVSTGPHRVAGPPPPAVRAGPSFVVAASAQTKRVHATLEASNVSLSAHKKRLRDAADGRNWNAGADALLSLTSEGGVPAFDAREVSAAALVTLNLTFTENPKTDAVFDALANRLGADGIDVLYDISSKHGGARAANKADELLAKRAVRERATLATRAALTFRDASCEDKAHLFGQVSQEGDERALMLLERLRGTNCSASRCCYIKHRALNESIARMKARLGKG